MMTKQSRYSNSAQKSGQNITFSKLRMVRINQDKAGIHNCPTK